MELQAAYEAMRRYFARYGDEPAGAIEGVTCKYRTKDGRCCAVGCLIPPALYDKRLENNIYGGSVYGLVHKAEDSRYAKAVVDFLGITPDNVREWAELQGAHDTVASREEGATGNEVVVALDAAAGSLGLETPATLREHFKSEADQAITGRFGTA